MLPFYSVNEQWYYRSVTIKCAIFIHIKVSIFAETGLTSDTGINSEGKRKKSWVYVNF